MSRTLLITNDFPPRPGGIQSFVHNLAVRQPPGSVVVYASSWRGAEKFDADQPFEVVRERTRVLLPTPLIARRAARLARAYDSDTVWFGAAGVVVVVEQRGQESGWHGEAEQGGGDQQGNHSGSPAEYIRSTPQLLS